ncbi:LysR substrate-binding domain-containing protein [Ktedonobacter robiniae]|uniref:LysR family transcriptional regulator n=1 Tax=Ktedonobacter robiniae TaxID=2778365 RepID=A0ABQ3V8H1_9CHLR|nr:LysR substrate-binding domain-containing protein [Ktedonobacter robiniae]GHO60920.1 LysR family transcriptional regulator [Ktedonobacter robiniae]
MELRHLRYFVAVAEELHFARAAERLHMTQQPLSFQIKQLEEELGVTLFRRTTRRVELTEAGRVLLPEVYSALAHLQMGVETARRAERGETGSLVIGYVSIALYNLIPPAVRLFRERFPDVQITLRELCSPDLEEQLLEGAFDVGLVVRGMHVPELANETVLHEQAIVAMPKNHPLGKQAHIPLRTLASEPFVMYERSQRSLIHDQVIAMCLQAGFSPTIIQEAASEQAVIGLVAAGVGIALVPTCLSGLRTDEVSYRPLIDPRTSVEYAVTWKREHPSPFIENFLNIVREVSQRIEAQQKALLTSSKYSQS